MPKIGILEDLTHEQRECLITWLELYPRRQVLEKLAAPPPDGFNIHTHLTTLRRFEVNLQVSSKFESIGLARNLLHSSEDLDLLKRGATSSLAQTALQLSASLDPVRISAAAKLLAALKRDDFRERELELTRDRLAIEQARLDLERQKTAALLASKTPPAENSSHHASQQFEDAARRAYGENRDQ